MNTRKWIIPLSIGGMIAAGAAGAYAASNLQTIQAYLNHGIAIEVNGAAFSAADNEGTKLPPITYEGSTYLPVRAVAEALKVPISYDEQQNKVSIGTGAGTESPPPAAGTNRDVRPAYLPPDLPLPADFKIVTSVDSSENGKKSFTFNYLSKESVDALGLLYKNYVKNKTFESGVQIVDSSGITITGVIDGVHGISIIGGESASSEGYTDILITWSEE
ncbi:MULTISPECIES: stalk domain-containing protein [unclassified Paenibacillus]|uniref:stalk domain-containing protein n=1 Tax=unclassified Paenibacillus TaxID=185978 RepID=UPI0015A037DB|nr:MULTISPECIES: stalk domain-containing protein [unclassified Paenibacillus]